MTELHGWVHFYVKLLLVECREKSTFHPRTGHKVPEGEYRCSCALSLISVLDVMGGQHHTPAALPPGNDLIPIV